MSDLESYPFGYPDVSLQPSLGVSLSTPTVNQRLVATLISLEFLSAHGTLRDARDNFAATGPVYARVQPFSAHVWSPLTHSRSQRIRIRLTFSVEPACALFAIYGDGGRDEMRFQTGILTATGQPQVVELDAARPLSQNLCAFSSEITWWLQGSGVIDKIGASGPHEIFVLYDKPIETNSMEMTNWPTYKRIKLLVDNSLVGGKGRLDDIAGSIQGYLNAPGRVRFARGSIDYSKTDGDQVWQLLDGGAGMCGELSFLMEMMLRLLGIYALQKHVKGATRLPIENTLSYAKHERPAESRTCEDHGHEDLWLVFRAQPPSLNEGEGCCECNGRFYTLFTSKNIVGFSKGQRTAAHHVLLQLEAQIRPKLGYFLRWVASTDGQYGLCPKGFPTVPPDPTP